MKKIGRRRLVLRLIGQAVFMCPIPITLWRALEAAWWIPALIAISTLMYAALALPPWAEYRASNGRPLSIAKYIPDDLFQ